MMSSLAMLCLAAVLPVTVADSYQHSNVAEAKDACDVPGVFFYRLEPSFYTGFAPRSQEPGRIHIHLGRGNQLRVTVVLSDQIISEYPSDLSVRYRVYKELIEKDLITLTQNKGAENFFSRVETEGILALAEQKNTTDENVFKIKSLAKLMKLNPGKIFHIRMNFVKRMQDWSQFLENHSLSLSRKKDIELVNAMLPTRMMITHLSGKEKKLFQEVIHLHQGFVTGKTAEHWNRFYSAARGFFTAVTDHIYSFNGDFLDFYEFTGIYPVGTLNEFAKFDGQEIPLYPCPGKRKLMVHQRSKVADHIPAVSCYSYLPWIPYMHVGKRLHNSFHTLWFNIDTKKNKFIPEKWRHNKKGSRNGKPYPHLWLVSRGPMSHGCTHVNAGHISELRQLLPSDEASLRKVVTFRNKSNHYDVFDIDGNGVPEVMGVKYFYAYSLRNKKPHKMRTASDRKSFYQWLYKDGYHYDSNGRVVFDEALTSSFYGSKPVEGKTYRDISLYEADYSPEKIQFYKTTNITFIRELRRVSSSYAMNRKVLKLDRN
jgi:hypothetical protein